MKMIAEAGCGSPPSKGRVPVFLARERLRVSPGELREGGASLMPVKPRCSFCGSNVVSLVLGSGCLGFAPQTVSPWLKGAPQACLST